MTTEQQCVAFLAAERERIARSAEQHQRAIKAEFAALWLKVLTRWYAT